MISDTLDLNLAIAYTYVITRLFRRCWFGEHSPITHAETRPMPWTLDDIALQRPFIQWTTGMRTCCRDGKELETLPQ